MSDLSKLSSLVDDSQFIDPPGNNTNEHSVRQGLYLYPQSTEEISEVLKFCSNSKIPLIPSGNGSKFFMHTNQNSANVVLSLKNMNKLIDHETADLVSTAECGLTLQKYQSSLKKNGQFLPVDNPFSHNATIGGVISCNIPGASSTKYGTCRELLLGIKAVRADGKIISGGAKVVKNVAGYDIPKLLVGAHGTLCVITEATFRLYPRQEYSETAGMLVDDYSKLEDLFKGISKADINPLSVDITDKKLTGNLFPNIGGRILVLYRLEGFENSVFHQMKELQSVTAGYLDEFFRLSGRSEKNLWKKIDEFPFEKSYSVTCRASLPVNYSFRFFEVLKDINESMQVEIDSILRPERGTVIFGIDGSADDTVYAANLIRSQAQALYGSVVFTSTSGDLEGKIEKYAYPRNPLKVMKTLKKQFDPFNILNPGVLFKAND